MLAAAMPFFGVITFAAFPLQKAGWTNITEAVKRRILPTSALFIKRPLIKGYPAPLSNLRKKREIFNIN
jgi:hypothetical protein